jgi:tetratricopeptide (TPR) repeat protein
MPPSTETPRVSPAKPSLLSVFFCVHLWRIPPRRVHLRRVSGLCGYLWPAALCAWLMTGGVALAQTKTADPAAPLDAAIAAAERALRDGEPQIAESRYRDALYQGWVLAATVALGDGRVSAARDAFARAAAAVVDNDEAMQALATVDLQLGDHAAALPILTRLVAAHPKDPARRRLLAQALVANRQMDEAVQALEEAHAAAPQDAETAFALAGGYLRVKKVDAADRLFASVAAARPIAQTYVLIGRAYRDAAQYDRARTALKKALALDPRVRRAHYYLGTTAVMSEGVVRLDEAIAEFRQELKIAPDDPLANLRLGMALVESRREREALAPLQIAARSPGADWQTFQYLGRCQLALGSPAEAVTSLQRALELSASVPAEARIGNLPYQLALALRAAGRTAEADKQFAVAAADAAERTRTDRENLDRFMRDAGDAGASESALPLADAGPLGAMPKEVRDALAARVSTGLVRAYQNLGILQAQAGRFDRAATAFEEAVALDPASPQLQYFLGVAFFNLQRYDKAAPALTKVVAADPANVDARRMLALSCLNTEEFARTVDLLRDDPLKDTDASLQLAYGVALVRSGRAAEAEALFGKLLAAHADSPELNVVLGQAHAEQGDYDAAVTSLRRALELKSTVAEANSTLGIIFLKQGKLEDSEQALKAELASHPGDVRTRYTLATVYELNRQVDAALREVRAVLKTRPEYADARYLFGKILLAQGDAPEAAAQLEVAAKLAPDDANVHYQLGQAYQRLGRSELAQQQFDIFRTLKDKRRGGGL